jgi:hypothetical protein
MWQRAVGTTRDNGYPYYKHVPDCDICRSADLLESFIVKWEATFQPEPKKINIKQLLDDVIEHCEYCGWGNIWSREFAADLVKRVEAYQAAAPDDSRLTLK